MNKRTLFQALLLLLFARNNSFAQQKTTHDLIQFSGVVVNSDSLQPIPYASVMIRHAGRGTVTDFYGFFSFVAMKGDTIDFNYIGYKPARFTIPDSLNENRYSLIQTLSHDTITLREAVIYPWPTKDEFKRAFLELQLPDNDMKRAQRNLEMARNKEVIAAVPVDGSLSYKFAQAQQQSKLYSAGQYPMNNLLNPLAWAAFIDAWKKGAFKRKD
jgi:hypothetical protein